MSSTSRTHRNRATITAGDGSHLVGTMHEPTPDRPALEIMEYVVQGHRLKVSATKRRPVHSGEPTESRKFADQADDHIRPSHADGNAAEDSAKCPVGESSDGFTGPFVQSSAVSLCANVCRYDSIFERGRE
jgi:hypothetical protein